MTGSYLQEFLAPFRRWLDKDEVTELIVNKPGEVWIETEGTGHLVMHEAEWISDNAVEQLAYQVANSTSQGLSRERPALSARLPCGSRIQVLAPPATTSHWAIAIRRQRRKQIDLSEFCRGALARAPRRPLSQKLAASDPIAFLKDAITRRATILVSGGTSSGKTSLLNALIGHVPQEERLITIEDTPEILATQPNSLSLVAVRGELGETRLDTDELLQASLRMRPDRIVVGELRGAEAVSFLRAINTGHRGSFSTIHANSPGGALEQLALLVVQSGIGMKFEETLTYARNLVDVVVQVEKTGARREIVDISILENA